MGKKVPLQWKNGRPVPVMDKQLADFPGEDWKEIPDFDGNFLLSSYGRVKSIARYVHYKNGREVFQKAKILTIGIGSIGKSPIMVWAELHKERKHYRYAVNRLVYNLFVSPFDMNDKRLTITKIDDDPLNCHYKNLRLQWVSEAFADDHAAIDLREVYHNVIKPVNQYDKNGIFIRTFNSTVEAAQSIGLALNSIQNAIYNKRLSGKKFYLQYGVPCDRIDVSQLNPLKKQFLDSIKKPVQKLTSDGKVVETYESLISAAIAIGAKSSSGIQEACKTNKASHGYHWRYADNQEISTGIAHENENTIIKYKARNINQYDLSGVFVNRYNSISEAAKAVGATHASISMAATKENKIANDHYWRLGDPKEYIDISEYKTKQEEYFRSMRKSVQKLTLDGQVIETFLSTSSAANSIGTTSSVVKQACENPHFIRKGFRWRYAD